MAFRHGVYKSEVPTSLISPVQGEAGLPVVVGASPVFMASLTTGRASLTDSQASLTDSQASLTDSQASLTDSQASPQAKNVNVPVLCYTYSEAVQALGFVHRDWDKWTLCEFIYSQFALFGQSPAVFINVFDPAKHKEAVTDETKTVTDKELNLGPDVIISAGFTFKDDEGEDLTLHYTAAYDDDGNAILTFTDAALPSSVKVSYTKARPDMITASDIIGGVSATTGAYTGLELVNRVFPKFRLIPGIICAPKWSENPSVAAVMKAKSENINGLFTCISVADIPSDAAGARVYSAAPEWKNSNNYADSRQIVCWPKVKLGDDTFCMSTQLAGVMNATDRDRGDVPYKSPSNENFQMDSCVDASGNEIALGFEEANYLNSQGIVTALNFIGGWKAWGNWTAAYPSSTDPKDCQISVRRMFDFVGNTFITTFWQKVDEPLTPRFIRTIVNSFNVYLNGLTAREYLLGGRVEMLEDENPATDLQAGTVKFHIYMTPPVPASVIEGILEFDPDYFSGLVEALG